MDKREFEVELIVTRRHLITTFSRNSEEAERDAEDLLEDGEEGTVLSTEIESSEAWPIGEDAEEPDEDEEDLDGFQVETI